MVCLHRDERSIQESQQAMSTLDAPTKVQKEPTRATRHALGCESRKSRKQSDDLIEYQKRVSDRVARSSPGD